LAENAGATGNSAKEETQMGFVYQHISVEQRMQIGVVAAMHKGSYGLVTGLARELGTSRKFIYSLADRVRVAAAEALAPRRPGPAGREHAIVVDERRLDRAIVTLALVGHASQRAISDCLGEIYDIAPSLGYVNGVLKRAAGAAAEFNDSLVLPLAEAQVAADELFALGQAHLAAVDYHSLLILALRQAERCDGAAWHKELTGLQGRGVELKRLGSDGGAALAAAMARLPEVEHHLDLWHALRRIGRAECALEQAAYAALAKEWQLEKKVEGMRASHPMGGLFWQRFEEAQGEAQRQVCRYDDLRVLGLWAREALQAIDPQSGRLRRREECLVELGVVVALLRTVGATVASELADYLAKAGPALLGYVDRLGERIGVLAEELGEEGVRRLCREWRLEREVGKGRRCERRGRQLAYERAHLLAVLHWGQDYQAARRLVVATIEGVMRGSSLAECVNSWLRPYADLMKGLKERFLPLFVLYRNAHVFARGKRAGHSPLELAGIQTPSGDWLDWLGLGTKPLPQSKEVLPIAA
jgi:hypothetical protein